MIVFEKPKVKRERSDRVRGSIVRRVRDSGRYTGNVLDASAPSRRRKEREGGKKKKHSCLKKIILQERESRREQRLLLRGATMPDVKARRIQEEAEIIVKPEVPSYETTSISEPKDRIALKEEQSQEDGAVAASKTDDNQSRVNDIITLALQDIRTNPKLWMHNRKFRDYCNHFLNPQLDKHLTQVIEDLVRFQDRLFHKDPVKARARKRMVIGLKEVNKHLKLNKLKCVVIAPDLEKVPAQGGLDEKIYEIIALASSSNTPTVFGLKKKTLGYLCKKKVPVSCIGILNYQGSEEHFMKMLEGLEELKTSYDAAYRNLAAQLPGGAQRVNAVTPEAGELPEGAQMADVVTPEAAVLPKEEKLNTIVEEHRPTSEGAEASGVASAQEVNSSFLEQLRRQMSLSRESNSSFEDQLEKNRVRVGTL